MNMIRILALAAACALPALASAQWQWVDKDGRKVFSDQPPPANIPDASILKRPGTRAAAPQAAAVSAAAPAAASAPKVSGKDKQLEDKKKQAELAEAEKKKAQEEKLAALRDENCKRLRGDKATLDSGMRIARVNAKGEREVIDDAQRAAEIKRVDGLIARDCKPQ